MTIKELYEKVYNFTAITTIKVYHSDMDHFLMECYYDELYPCLLEREINSLKFNTYYDNISEMVVILEGN